MAQPSYLKGVYMLKRKKGGFGRINIVPKDIYAYNVGIIGESGIGKEQPLDAEIITPDGIKTMGDMRVGSKVIGQDGKAYNVVGVYPQGVKPIYKIEFSDGSVVESGLDHLWKTQSKKQRENGNFSIRTLREMLQDYDIQKSGFKYSVELPKAVEFEQNVDLKINPYIMGVLLGDGYLTGNSISIKNEERDIVEKVQVAFAKNFESGNSNYNKYNVLGLVGSKEFRDAIKEYGINVSSKEKFIPKDYLFSDKESRRQLLEGLIDTDGSVSKGCSLRFSSYSEVLAKDVRFLAKSLGFASTFKKCFRSDGDVEYYVQIMGDISKLKLSKKHTKKVNARKFDYTLTIRNIEYTRHAFAQCIMIDNPEHLYLTNDFIVTHNTTLMKEVCEKTAGRDGYMLLDIGREDGTKAISGVVTEKVTTFAKQFDEFGEKIDKYKDLDGVGLLDIVEDIIENKDEFYPDLKVLVFDTLDELIGITEPYIVEKDNLRLRSEGKPANVKTINEAYGGFMRGQDEVIEEIMKVKDNLNAVGVSFWFVGHTKMRTKSDPLSGVEYDSFTTNLTHRYFNAFKDKLHFLGVIVMDRNIDKTIEKQFGHTKTKGTLVGEKRIINFRDDNYAIDSKSRFQEIEDNIEYGSDNFINALETAIEKERAKDIGVDTAKIEKERAKEDIKIAEIRKETAKKKLIGVVEKSTDELLSEIKETLNSVSDSTKKMDIVNAIPKELEKLGAKDLMSASSEQLNSVLDFVTQSTK